VVGALNCRGQHTEGETLTAMGAWLSHAQPGPTLSCTYASCCATHALGPMLNGMKALLLLSGDAAAALCAPGSASQRSGRNCSSHVAGTCNGRRRGGQLQAAALGPLPGCSASQNQRPRHPLPHLAWGLPVGTAHEDGVEAGEHNHAGRHLVPPHTRGLVAHPAGAAWCGVFVAHARTACSLHAHARCAT
jgi:hypothetical protein